MAPARLCHPEGPLQEWAVRNLHKGKCKILHLGRNYPVHQYGLGDDRLESRFTVKHLGVLGDTKLNVSQQYAIALRRQMVTWVVLGKVLPAD